MSKRIQAVRVKDNAWVATVTESHVFFNEPDLLKFIKQSNMTIKPEFSVKDNEGNYTSIYAE